MKPLGLLGRKVGMTQIFNQAGAAVTVTVIAASDNRVVGLRTHERNGYAAVQIGFAVRAKERRKTLLHNFPDKKRPRYVREFRADQEKLSAYKVGQELPVDTFKEGDFLDVTGASIGKGFQGVVKRYGMHGGPATHGSHFHRHPGSVGHCAEPARIFKGKKMPGRMGGDCVTVQNLPVVAVDAANGLLLVKGAVPGKRNNLLVLRSSVKKNFVPVEVVAKGDKT